MRGRGSIREAIGPSRLARLEHGLDAADAGRDRLVAQDAEPAGELAAAGDMRPAAELAADHRVAVADRVDRDGVAVLLAERADRTERARVARRHRRAVDHEVACDPAVDQLLDL